MKIQLYFYNFIATVEQQFDYIRKCIVYTCHSQPYNLIWLFKPLGVLLSLERIFIQSKLDHKFNVKEFQPEKLSTSTYLPVATIKVYILCFPAMIYIIIFFDKCMYCTRTVLYHLLVTQK